ncbi:BTB/POZ domain-containing protein [Hirsutella rhossiliensis]|uniref:BTB/POZ domain-containing protein n=1 Tax=Hirsutella rhossiliensis TaxID=111463 RepID=A0A9P8SH43_9HYPO|nr:BTB/POZ domain-containing protein [Hirsutella rhossiliensis]KAH0961774.1 BTB/POZ domain-containing protein [Hirsutella rhossiliensis]
MDDRLQDELRDELLDSLRGLYATSEYLDCTITCGDYELRVHKAVTSPRSSFFRAAFAHDMQERATGIVNLEDDDPEAVKSMVYYLYHLDYPSVPTLDRSEESDSLDRTVQDSSSRDTVFPSWEDPGARPAVGQPRQKKNQEQPKLFHHCRVYALAEKYDIPSLKKLAYQKFKTESEKWWDHSDFVKAARKVYATTLPHDRGLRDIVVATIRHNPRLLDREEVQSVLKESELAFDVVMDSHKRSVENDYWEPQTLVE